MTIERNTDLERRREALILSQAERIEKSETRLTMSYAFIKMLREAYDALLHHGINYRELPEFKNAVDIQNVDTPEAKSKAYNWLARMTSGIVAAVRRKGFTLH